MKTGQAAVTSLLIFVLSCHGTAEACGWNTTALSGTVESPNFPGNYTNNLICVYIITAPDGYQVTLNFTDFDIVPASQCNFDYVEIRDGGATSPVIGGRRCNTTLPNPVRTFGNQMWIKFASDVSKTGQGFRATFTSANLQAPFFLIASSVPQSAAGGGLHRMDVETKSNYRIPIAGGLFRPIALDYDPVEQTIYWTEVGLFKGIRGAFLNGSGAHIVLNTGSASVVDGLAVDHLSRLIFYTDEGRDMIAMLTMSTFAHKTIINTSLDKPRAIVLNTADGVMFWTDWGAAPKIERASYDGTNRRTLVNTGLYFVNALALDVPNNRLYWADANILTDMVEVSDMEGNGRRTLRTLGSAHHFFGLTLLDNDLYVTDWFPGSNETNSLILRVDKNTGIFNIYGHSSSSRLKDIHVHEPQLYSVNSGNGCGDNNGGCSAFCLPLPSSSSKCTCPDGQTLSSDRSSCVDGFDTTSPSIPTTTPTTTTTTTPTTTTTTTPTTTSTTTTTTTSTTTPTTTTTTTPTTTTTTTPTTTTTTTPTTTQTTTTTTPSTTTPTTTTSTSTSPLPAYSVVVATTNTQPFDTNGDLEMTLTCDPDIPVDVTSHVWSVPCTEQTGNTCVFKPQPPQDDGMQVTCTLTSSDGRMASGSLKIELHYPSQVAPTINGFSMGTVYREGQSLTLTCSVHGGKPLVTSVLFTCGSHGDTSPDIFSRSEVHSVLSITRLSVEDDGKMCFCTAKWKDTEWYRLSATAVLKVEGSQTTTEKPPVSSNQFAAIGGGAGGAVVVIAVVIIVVACYLIRRRRQKRNEPSRRKDGDREEHIYMGLGSPGQWPPLAESQPHVNTVCDQEAADNERHSHYDTLDNVAEAVHAYPADDNLNPVPSSSADVMELIPFPCSWQKNPSGDNGYIHAVPNPRNIYAPFRMA